ncbi:MAG: hypothetical protein ABIZ09_18885, partial [Rhodoferax sp.]
MKLSMRIAAASLPFLFLCATAQAQPRKCTAPDGKVTYSNVACPGNTATERSVDTSGNTMDGSILREQAQKDKAAAAQNQAKEQERATLEANSRQQSQANAADAARQQAQNAKIDEAAYANCTRDVVRQSITEDVKAELLAACRTAGASQRQSGMSETTLRECVRNVDRTGAYANDKARQIAICHGADVKTEPAVVVLRPTVRVSGPPRITTCTGNQCSDDRGQRYFK